jgi:hypothetical protein
MLEPERTVEKAARVGPTLQQALSSPWALDSIRHVLAP